MKKKLLLFNKKYIIIFVIILIIIIIIIGFLFLINKKNESFMNNNDNNDLKYYRCEKKMLGKILKDVFDNNNISQSNTDWDIYIPCGYNDIESELKQILIKDSMSNKYIFGLNGCDTIVSKNKIW